MSFLEFGLNQTCTYWQSTGVDGFNQPTFAAPVVLHCRWEERTEKIQTDEGTEALSRSRVFLAEDIAIGDYLAIGNLTSEPDPRDIPLLAHRVLDWRKTPGIYAEMFERKAYL